MGYEQDAGTPCDEAFDRPANEGAIICDEAEILASPTRIIVDQSADVDSRNRPYAISKPLLRPKWHESWFGSRCRKKEGDVNSASVPCWVKAVAEQFTQHGEAPCISCQRNRGSSDYAGCYRLRVIGIEGAVCLRQKNERSAEAKGQELG